MEEDPSFARPYVNYFGPLQDGDAAAELLCTVTTFMRLSRSIFYEFVFLSPTLYQSIFLARNSSSDCHSKTSPSTTDLAVKMNVSGMSMVQIPHFTIVFIHASGSRPMSPHMNNSDGNINHSSVRGALSSCTPHMNCF